jgi:hypothetical protein
VEPIKTSPPMDILWFSLPHDSLAAWGSKRIMYQQCGQVWMDTLAEIGKDFSTTTQLDAIQLVTWNNYEEGSELETGIDNCVSVAPWVSGNLLSWTVTGSLTTIELGLPISMAKLPLTLLRRKWLL